MIYLQILAFFAVYTMVAISMIVRPPQRRRAAAERHTRSHWYKL